MDFGPWTEGFLYKDCVLDICHARIPYLLLERRYYGYVLSRCTDRTGLVCSSCYIDSPYRLNYKRCVWAVTHPLIDWMVIYWFHDKFSWCAIIINGNKKYLSQCEKENNLCMSIIWFYLVLCYLSSIITRGDTRRGKVINTNFSLFKRKEMEERKKERKKSLSESLNKKL